MDYYIYKIACKDPLITDVYVGSTTKPRARVVSHKSKCNNINGIHYYLPVYQFIRETGGWENWEFIIIETIFCNNKKEALFTEKKWILDLNAKLNKKLPTRNNIQYNEDHKEILKLQVKQYHETHKEQIKDYKKKYRETHKEQIKDYNKQYRETHKSK
jgi:hypothetical protein